jgi:hypothetical protein
MGSIAGKEIDVEGGLQPPSLFRKEVAYLNLIVYSSSSPGGGRGGRGGFIGPLNCSYFIIKKPCTFQLLDLGQSALS